MLFEFAPSGNEVRVYDWSRKSTFALDATECGALLSLDKNVGKEFFHDPNLGSPESGVTTKVMKWTPTQDGNGMFLSLQVKDKVRGQSTCSVPVSWAEFEVIKSICAVAIPKLLGIDQALSGSGFMSAAAPSMSYGGGGSRFPPPEEAPEWRTEDLADEESFGPVWG